MVEHGYSWDAMGVLLSLVHTTVSSWRGSTISHPGCRVGAISPALKASDALSSAHVQSEKWS